MRPHPFDLFGEIPVTEDEVFAWVAAIAPRWLTPERAFHGYVNGWNVVEKIRAAKAEGTFYERIEARTEPWHARLALAAVL